MHWSMRSFNIPHWATHGHLTVFPARGSREFEPCLAGVGNLNRKCQLFPAEHKCYVYKYAGVSVKCFTIASEWLRRKVLKGQGFKAWSTCKRILSLMLPFTKKWVGHMNTREFEQTNLQKFKCPGIGRMSRLQIDERITESLSLSLSSVHWESGYIFLQLLHHDRSQEVSVVNANAVIAIQ